MVTLSCGPQSVNPSSSVLRVSPFSPPQDFPPSFVFLFATASRLSLSLLDHSISMTYCGGTHPESLISQLLQLQLHPSTPLPSQTFSVEWLLHLNFSPVPSPLQTLSPQFQQLQQIVLSKGSNLCCQVSQKLCFFVLSCQHSEWLTDRSFQLKT